MIYDIITVILLLSGALILFSSALGMMRLPDIYCRSHALAKSMPLGLNLLLIGAWLHLGHDLVGFKSFLAILFQIISIPVAGHLIGLLAYEKNVKRWKEKPIDKH